MLHFANMQLQMGYIERMMPLMGNPTDEIKSSTRAALEAIRGEKSRLQKRLSDLDSRERVILGWIEEEEGPQQVFPFTPVKDVTPPGAFRPLARPSLQDTFRDVLQDGIPRSNVELAELAKMRGLIAEPIDLRSIHSTMMSLLNGGSVIRQDGKWTVKKGGA